MAQCKRDVTPVHWAIDIKTIFPDTEITINSMRPSDAYMSVNYAIIGSDNGLSPGQRQAIIWTNPGILLMGLFWTNFVEILIKIDTFSSKKMHLKISSGKRRPFCLSLNVLSHRYKDQLSRYRDSHYKITWSKDHLIFTMRSPIMLRWHLYTKTLPRTLLNQPMKIMIWKCLMYVISLTIQHILRYHLSNK